MLQSTKQSKFDSSQLLTAEKPTCGGRCLRCPGKYACNRMNVRRSTPSAIFSRPSHSYPPPVGPRHYNIYNDEEFDYLCKDCFVYFDTDNDGEILPGDYANALRSLGLVWPASDVIQLQQKYPKGLTWANFKTISKKRATEEFQHLSSIKKCKDGRKKYNIEEDKQSVILTDKELLELRMCFDVFDPKKRGWVYLDDIRHVMTTVGEKLTEIDFDQLLDMQDFRDLEALQFRDFVEIFARYMSPLEFC